MSLAEINDLIGQLLVLFWSAAAGNIQLNNFNASACSSNIKTIATSESTITLTDEDFIGGSMEIMSSTSMTQTNENESDENEESIDQDTTPTILASSLTNEKRSSDADMMVVHDMETTIEDNASVRNIIDSDKVENLFSFFISSFSQGFSQSCRCIV